MPGLDEGFADKSVAKELDRGDDRVEEKDPAILRIQARERKNNGAAEHQQLEADLDAKREITKPAGEGGDRATDAESERAELDENERRRQDPPVRMGELIAFHEIKEEAGEEEQKLRGERNEIGEKSRDRDGEPGKIDF